MSEIFYYNGDEYKTRPSYNGLGGYFAATAVSGAILAPLAYTHIPIARTIEKERVNNELYKDTFYKILDESGLKDKGVTILEAQKVKNIPNDYKIGKNAAYIPKTRQVLINTENMMSAGFHELGHAMNDLQSKYGLKYLAKMRRTGYVIAGLMEYFAIFSRTKPKGAPRTFTDIIEDNCGKIAFIALVPTLIEEAAASYRGLNAAKKAGLEKSLIKNLEKMCSNAFLTYGSRAVLGGLAVYASRKVMDAFTRPKKVKTPYSSETNFFIS